MANPHALWFWEVPRSRPLTSSELQAGVWYEVTIIGNEVVAARQIDEPWQTRTHP